MSASLTGSVVGASSNAKKTLVVYYSRTGFTSAVAKRIARDCNADLLSIRSIKTRRGIGGYLRSSLEAVLHARAGIRSTTLRSNYDLVVIGTPVWFGNMSSPVRAFIQQHQPAFKRLAFFCTYGGSGADKVLHDMEALCGIHPIAKVGLRDQEIQHPMREDKLLDFTNRLNRAVESAPKTTVHGAVNIGEFAHS
jgi:flavodoxin